MKIGKVYSTEYKGLIVSAEADGTIPNPWSGKILPCWKMTISRADNPEITTSIRINPNAAYSYPARRALLMQFMLLCCFASDARAEEARFKRRTKHYCMGNYRDEIYKYCKYVRDSLLEVVDNGNELARLRFDLHDDANNTPWEDEPEDEDEPTPPDADTDAHATPDADTDAHAPAHD